MEKGNFGMNQNSLSSVVEPSILTGNPPATQKTRAPRFRKLGLGVLGVMLCSLATATLGLAEEGIARGDGDHCEEISLTTWRRWTHRLLTHQATVEKDADRDQATLALCDFLKLLSR